MTLHGPDGFSHVHVGGLSMLIKGKYEEICIPVRFQRLHEFSGSTVDRYHDPTARKSSSNLRGGVRQSVPEACSSTTNSTEIYLYFSTGV